MDFIKQSNGRIINTASFLGRFAFPFSCAYSASKFGMQGFTDSLRREMKFWNVTVHTVEPGYFRTPLTQLFNITKTQYNNLPENMKKAYGENFVENRKLNK